MLLPIAFVIAVIGALLWTVTVADDGGEGGDVVQLETPGEFIDPAVSNPEHEGDAFPAVDLETADGETVRLESDGRPMVVNLWYSTCPPCARELGAFAAVEADVGEEVRFVGVNPLDDGDTMVQFASDRGVQFELLRDPNGDVGYELRVMQYPVTLFVDGGGTIVRQTGPLSEDELRDHVAELLA